MKRKIIQIDEEKCNGCALCTTVCAEAALEMRDGKAKVVGDFLCDGMGACLDVCPVGALKIVEKDVDEYNPKKAYERVKSLRGEESAKKVHGIEDINQENDHKDHQPDKPMACGCAGSMVQDFTKNASQNENQPISVGEVKSELKQWPIQLHLLMPQAPYFKNADLVIVADCVPFAYGNFHQRFLKDKRLVMFCPKLDEGQEQYIEKLTELFETQDIKSITIVHMEVPCCGGVEHIVKQALEKSGQNITIKDYTISLQGEIV